jgi:GNAT superfamily N-acetyltransferase
LDNVNAGPGVPGNKYHFMLTPDMKRQLLEKIGSPYSKMPVSMHVAGPSESSQFEVKRWLDKGVEGKRDLNRIDALKGQATAGWITHHPGTDGNYLWLKGMYVEPEYRRKGLGRLLMREAIKDAGGRDVRLRARPFRDSGVTAEDLVRFYKSMGFELDDKDLRMTLRGGEKLGSGLMHIAGPSGSGKSTLLKKIQKKHPGFLVKDLDDFDHEATKKLFKGVSKSDYTDEMFADLYKKRQSLIDGFMRSSAGKPVILGGHHTEGPPPFSAHKLDVKERLYLNTRVDRS